MHSFFPEFFAEIISDSTQNTDEKLKKQLCGKHGFFVYWIVPPTTEYVEVHHDENQEMKLMQIAQKGYTIISKAMERLKLNIDKIFA